MRAGLQAKATKTREGLLREKAKKPRDREN